ncbi:MAG: OB-fold nucleic acid binding domain-containing protein, partial [Burkholderiaceae bacterium]
PVLAETYGIFVYQEQVMLAAQVLAGYSLGGADILRKAMGKKKAEEMAKQRQIFRDGAARQHIAQARADEVFDLMEKFAGYGFNKSHAAAYALLAYHTAWLKVHCTVEFYAANMTVELGDTDKLRVLLNDARQFGIAFEPPDVNRGQYRFEPIDDKSLRYGLGAVKGTGQGAIEAIVAAREGTGAHEGEGGGPFRSLFDFAARVDRQRVNKRVVEALIKAGAFDALHPDRATALASVSLAFDWADSQAAHADQGGLFDFADSHAASTQEPALVQAEPWSIKERLTLEKSALGFFLSGHLFDQSGDEVRRFARRPIAELADSRDPQLVAGIVGDLRVVNGARGRVAIFQLDDGSQSIEAVVNEDLLNANRERLREDELVIVQGKVQTDRFAGGLRLNINQVWDLAGARARFGKYLAVAVNGKAPPVAEVLRTWPARSITTEVGEAQQGLAIRLRLHRPAVEAELDLGDAARFWPSDEALARWKSLAHEGRATVVYE